MKPPLLAQAIAGGLSLATVSGCGTFPLSGIEFGQGTYGFTAPEGVEPKVVAGYAWWKFSTEGEVPWRGLFWLEPPETDTPVPGELDFDQLREIQSRYYPEKDARPGIYALRPDLTILRVPLADEEARFVLETIFEKRHLPPGSPATESFRILVAPHLHTIPTELSWHHGRRSDQEDTWVAP